MRAVVQRVISSSVTVDNKVVGKIEKGMTVLIGVEKEDTENDAVYIAEKLAGLRIFDDENGVMNLSVTDIQGEILSISQFTLLGDARKGKRPSWFNAEAPEKADVLYKHVNKLLRDKGIHVEEGIFQAEMLVDIQNDGPVTILIDSRKVF